MKTIEALLMEVTDRMSKERWKEWGKHHTVSVFTIWNQIQAQAAISADPALLGLVLQHENLLRVVVCVNERAIDAWLDGLEEIRRVSL